MKTRAFIPFDPDAMGGRVSVCVQAVPADAPAGCEVVFPEDLETGGLGDGENQKGTAKPLTNRQKFLLSDLAKHVYAALRGRGLLVGVSLEDWRRQIAVKACGQRISRASHGDYKAIQAAFLHERGDEAGERRAMVQAQSTPQSIALYKLRELLKQTHTPLAYAETLARRFYKTGNLADLTANQVWTLSFTIRNNASAAAGKGSAGNRFKSRKPASAKATAAKGETP